MLKYIQIENIAYVDDMKAGSRLWAHYVLIDQRFEPKLDRPSFDNIRQIRGFTNGGLPVFTYWIKPESEIEFTDHQGGNVKLLRDNGELINMGSGLVIKVDDIVLTIGRQDHSQPVKVTPIEVESCPHGYAVDSIILKYYQAPNYCVTDYVSADYYRNKIEDHCRKRTENLVF